MPASLTSTTSAARQERVPHGDWQTPPALASEVLSVLSRGGTAAGSVLEPTCGTGTFLAAAARVFPNAVLLGLDRSAAHIELSKRALRGTSAVLRVEDFFDADWERLTAELPEPLLILGNPPWVTSSTLGRFAAENAPKKSNFKRQSGFDALTGKSNFDISEWMLLRLLEAVRGRRFTLAMLCKAVVARRIMQRSAALAWGLEGSVYAVDARAHFAAAVSAVLLVVRGGSERGMASLVRHAGASAEHGGANAEHAVGTSGTRWTVFASLGAREPTSEMGVEDGQLFRDFGAYAATRALAGPSELEWRSGVKHDLTRVMELTLADGVLKNGLGETVELERTLLYPLCKGAELGRDKPEAQRFVLVTQTKLGEDTTAIRERAPATWRYLERHARAFEARKSRIYRGQPPFSMFGIGAYSFAPYKLATSALHKRLAFRVLAPREGRPVVLDDTAYFLPCDTLAQANELERALMAPEARRFLDARIFWDDMRPVNKGVLKSLSLDAALAAARRGLLGGA